MNEFVDCKDCWVLDDHTIQCRMPNVDLPSDLQIELEKTDGEISDGANGSVAGPGAGVASGLGPNGRDRIDVHVGLILDGFLLYQDISQTHRDIKMAFYSPPILSCADDIVFNPDASKTISIRGSKLTRGNRLIDVSVMVGDGVCQVVQLTDNEIECRPPVNKPNTGNFSFCNGDGLPLEVLIGYKEYSCRCVRYISPNIPLIVGLSVGCSLGLNLVIALLAVALILVARRRRQRRRQKEKEAELAKAAHIYSHHLSARCDNDVCGSSGLDSSRNHVE